MSKQFNGEKIIFSTNSARETGRPQAKKKMNLNLSLAPHTKINSK